jgi:hypothetical protein
MKNNLEIVTVVRDVTMYNACIASNPYLKNAVKHFCDNTCINRTIPYHYNKFINGFDFNQQAWIVFCHEDFEIQCDLEELLSKCNRDSLYGAVGARKKTLIPFTLCRWQIVGDMKESDKQGRFLHRPGARVAKGTICDTFDCCCLIVHSSLLEKHIIRFDEQLEFDLYVEDFCIQAKEQYGILSKILPLPSVHKSSHKVIPESYLRKLDYINAKWPQCVFAGTSTWIGGDIVGRHFKGWLRFIVMKFQNWLNLRISE